MMNMIELLAPAGDLEKLIIAVDYGADAVYFGGDSFSLRAGADNFSLEEMTQGIAYAHVHRNRRNHLETNKNGQRKKDDSFIFQKIR